MANVALSLNGYFGIFVDQRASPVAVDFVKKIEARKDGPRTLVDVASLTATTGAHETLLVLFSDSLGVRFAVGIEKFLATLLPRHLEFGRCDVPIRSAFLGDGT